MASVLELSDVSVVRDGNTILDSITWAVDSAERWVILGPNGAGKTTLLSIASASIHPSSGSARVLDDTLGKVDVFELRPRIGFASTALARRVPRDERVIDVVLTAAYSVTGRWNEDYEDVGLAERVIENLHAAGGRVHLRGSQLQQRGLTGAVGAEDHPALCGVDRPRDGLEDGVAIAHD